MFSRLFFQFRKPIFLSATLFACYNIHQRTYHAADKKAINQKELHNLMIHPEYYLNSLILLNNQKQELCNVINPNSRCYQLSEEQSDSFSLPQNYDFIAINGDGDCRLFKLDKNHDILKIQNFMKPIPILEEIDELKQILKHQENKIVLSYLPKESLSTLQDRQDNPLDQFSKQNRKDVKHFEEQFKELRYINLDKDSSHMIIRDQSIAAQLGLSQNDVGLVYVIKKTDISKESSFVWDGQEYIMSRIEHDPNVEKIEDLQLSIPNEYSDKWFKLLGVEKKEISSQVYSVDKYLKRLSLKQLPYVSHVYSEQQLNNLMVIAKQMNLSNILIYGLVDDRKINKVQRKLMNLKRSLNTHQQENLLIVISENEELLQKYFGIVEDNMHDQIRLLKLNEKEVIDEQKFERISFIKDKEDNLKLKDISEEILDEALRSQRYKYFGKVTTGRLKYFLQQSCPELEIKNVLSPRESDILLYQRYQEQTEELTKYNVISSGQIKDNLDKTIIYFYKPHCNNCNIMADSINKVSDIIDQVSKECINKKSDKLIETYRIQHKERFANLKILRYHNYI